MAGDPQRLSQTGGRCPPRAGRRLLLAALAALAGAGCDEERPPPPGSAPAVCAGRAFETCDIRAEACQQALFALSLCLYGDVDDRAPPPIRVLDEAAAVELLAGGSGGMAGAPDPMQPLEMAPGAAGFAAQVRGLELLGLLEPGLITDERDVIEVTVAGMIAYYLVTSGEIIVIDRGRASRLEDSVVLVHELIHVLQDRRYGLRTLGGVAGESSDADLALASLVEGEASMYQYFVSFAWRGLALERVDLAALGDELAGYGAALSLDAGSPAISARGIFPYTYGARFVLDRWRAAGAAGVEALYGALPRTTWQVLLSEALAPAEPRPFEAVPAPLEGYTLLEDDVAGAWLTAAAAAGLAPEGLREPLDALASGWRGDRLWLYAGEGGAVAAAWASEWADAAAAARHAELASALDPGGAAIQVDLEGTTTRITAVESAAELETWRARLAEAAPATP